MRCNWIVTALHQYKSRNAYRCWKWRGLVVLCTQREQDVKKGLPISSMEQPAKKVRGQFNFFSMLPFCHCNCQSAIAFLDAQMHERYDIRCWGLWPLRSLKPVYCRRIHCPWSSVFGEILHKFLRPEWMAIMENGTNQHRFERQFVNSFHFLPRNLSSGDTTIH